MAYSMTVFFIIVFLIGFAKTYIDWTQFEKRVRQVHFVEPQETRRVALKIGLVSIITGLAFGLVAVIVRFSSPSSTTEEMGSLSYIVGVLSCTLGWAFLVVLAFAVKVLTLRALYNKKSQ